jgi:tetratricopeptide (TPR) repeat protein
VIGLILCALAPATSGALSQEQAYSLFSQANESFRQATVSTDDVQSQKLYSKAILAFERIINEAQIKNSKLYYNLANTYFLNGELGKAILNYRRAEKLDQADADIRKNLDFARSKRIDKVSNPTEKQVLQTLFFWHYDFSTKTKFVVTCVCFGLVCLSLTVMVWFGRMAVARVVVIIAGIGLVCFFASVAIDTKIEADTTCGVITASEVIAHQADWQDSPPSFKEPLHTGTEFELIEERPGWYHVRLLDESDGWIPQDSAGLI